MPRYARVSRKEVLDEIIRLIDLALDPATPIVYADRYVDLARRFSMKYRVRIPRRYKMFICRGCKRILRPGRTAIFRVRSMPRRHIFIKCMRCGHVYRRIVE